MLGFGFNVSAAAVLATHAPIEIVAPTLGEALADVAIDGTSSLMVETTPAFKGLLLTYALVLAPAWMTINEDTGRITGIAPNRDATGVVTVRATNRAGSVEIMFNYAIMAIDIVAPSGHTLRTGAPRYGASTAVAVEVMLENVEIGAAWRLHVSSAGGGDPIVLTGTTAAANEIFDIDVSSLSSGLLTLSIVVKDAAGNEALPVTTTTMLDKVGPSLVTLVAEARDSTTFSWTASASETGTLRWVAIPDDAMTPSVEEVLSGQAAGGLAPLASGSAVLTTGSNTGFGTGLPFGRSVVLAFAARDDVDNASALVTTVSVVMPPPPPPPPQLVDQDVNMGALTRSDGGVRLSSALVNKGGPIEGWTLSGVDADAYRIDGERLYPASTGGVADGHVLTITATGPGGSNSATVTIIAVGAMARAYSVASVNAASAAYGAARGGDSVLFAGGLYLMADGGRISRSGAPSEASRENPVIIGAHPQQEVQLTGVRLDPGDAGPNTSLFTTFRGLSFVDDLTGDAVGRPSLLEIEGWDVSVESCLFISNWQENTAPNARVAIRTMSRADRLRVVDCEFDGCLQGINFEGYDVYFSYLVMRRILMDGIFAGICSRTTIENCAIVDKALSYVAIDVTSIRPNPNNPAKTDLVLTSAADLGRAKGWTLYGLSDGAGALEGWFVGDNYTLNGDTLTISYDSSDLPLNATCVIQGDTGKYGDCIQFASRDVGQQDDVTIQGCFLGRGLGPKYVSGGRGIYGGLTDKAIQLRKRWRIVNNLIVVARICGLSVDDVQDSTIRHNTVLNPLGALPRDGVSDARIMIGGEISANNVVIDNIANGISAPADTILSNNITLPLDRDFEPTVADIAAYQSVFRGPIPVTNGGLDPKVYRPKSGLTAGWGAVEPARVDLVVEGVVQPAATFSRASSAILWDGAAFQAVGPDVPRIEAGALLIE
ncbi:hypothetical protein F1188_16405, partial [Roseospira marina]